MSDRPRREHPRAGTPFGATGESFTVAVSNNHWFGDVIEHYRPSVLEVSIPS